MLLVSGLDERGSGGLFIFDGQRLLTIDRVASTGIAVGESTVGRLVYSAADYPPAARLVVYDESGVREFRRLDTVVDPHDLAIVDDGSWVAVSTSQNAIRLIRPDGSLETVWQPSFVPDSWHLNCVSVVDDELWATAFGRFESSRAWSGDGGRGRGFLRNLSTGEELGGLSHPHSPRFFEDTWWLCDSLEQSLVRWDGQRWERVASLSGYPRGLDTDGEFVFVGESAERGSDLEWSSLVVLRDGELVDRVPLPCAEVYDLRLCPITLVDGLRRGFSVFGGADGAESADGAEGAGRAEGAEGADGAGGAGLPGAARGSGGHGSAGPHGGADPSGDVRAGAVAPGSLLQNLGDPTVFHGIRAPLSPDEVAVRIQVAPPAIMAAGELRSMRAVVENRGSLTLASVSPYPVHLAYRWTTMAEEQIEGQRTRLGPALFPGGSASYQLEVLAPEAPGDYWLCVSLVQEGVFWLDEVAASNGVRVPVTVVERQRMAV